MSKSYEDIFGIKRQERVEGTRAIAEFYQDEEVVRTYEESRFESSGGRLKHLLDTDIVMAMLEHDTRRVLDLAAGTARISRDLCIRDSGSRFSQVVSADYSRPMLEEAMRLQSAQSSSLPVNADAFALPIPSNWFDAVVCLRFIRHLYLEARERLYQEVARVLRPRGLFIFDVCNQCKHEEAIATRGVYDELYTREKLLNEMAGEEFQVEQIVGLLYPTTRLLQLQTLGFPESLLIALVRHLEGRIRHISYLLPGAYLWIAKCRNTSE